MMRERMPRMRASGCGKAGQSSMSITPDQMIAAWGKRARKRIEQRAEILAETAAGMEILGIVRADVERDVVEIARLDMRHGIVADMRGGGAVHAGDAGGDGPAGAARQFLRQDAGEALLECARRRHRLQRNRRGRGFAGVRRVRGMPVRWSFPAAASGLCGGARQVPARHRPAMRTMWPRLLEGWVAACSWRVFNSARAAKKSVCVATPRPCLHC